MIVNGKDGFRARVRYESSSFVSCSQTKALNK